MREDGGANQALCRIAAESHLVLQDGSSQLYIACQNGHLETVRLLLDKGANKEVRGPVSHAKKYYLTPGTNEPAISHSRAGDVSRVDRWPEAPSA